MFPQLGGLFFFYFLPSAFLLPGGAGASPASVLLGVLGGLFLFFFFFLPFFHWQLSQEPSIGHAFGGASSVLSTWMLLEADLFFIQRGCRPRLLMSIDDFSICVAPRARR